MTQKEINEILEKHAKWLNNEKGGARACVEGLCSMSTNFEGVNLQEASLTRASFMWSNLTGANFSKAYLREANFQRSNLQKANFREADLWGAEFCGANIQEADFWGANLYYICIMNKKDVWWLNSKQFLIWKELFYEVKNYDLADKVFQSFLNEK